MKNLMFCLIFLMSTVPALSQLQKLEIGVDGLTCSQCSRSVYKKLTGLDFIRDVEMDLNNHTAVIVLENQKKYDLEQLAEAITSAGYTVRNIRLTFRKNEELVFEENYWVHNAIRYYYDTGKYAVLPDIFTAELVGRKYNSDRKLNMTLPSHNLISGRSYFVIVHD